MIPNVDYLYLHILSLCMSLCILIMGMNVMAILDFL